ncbi:hypothetical protein A3L14_06325 [Thermococcus thioreducens]|uniref:Uncharacterized protein n=2 Tax=Thermococcus thioreducens TaxID=277988 RepID=A0A0Q2QR58_9EURY|nr:hypothetical protein A3L14_06325 [Thermococcus thioreducens]KQH82469.1 hypothetical protein AMR53_05915 [Thermococcus thioreducens]SEV89285.1 hypothetical protein SAMN05216170_0690 [Thermococcus thioreducens]
MGVAAITMGPLTMKRIEALGFTILVVGLILVAATLWGASYSFQENVVISSGGYYVYKLEGYDWSVIQFSIKSTEPVTVCITDEVGLRILKSGDGALCLFKVDDTTSVEKIWRFPKDGPMYMIIIPESNGGPVSVSIHVKGGLVLW